MEQNYTLRLAEPQDLAAVTALRMAMLREVAAPLPEDMRQAVEGYLRTHLADGSCLCALMEEDGVPVASAMLCVSESVPDEVNLSGRFATLASVYTLPRYRGQGRMEQLLRWLLQQGRAAGIKEVYAGAERKAIPLYQRIGFVLTETEMVIAL